jgi:hypothetical protein
MAPGNGQLPKPSRLVSVDTIGAAHGVGADGERRLVDSQSARGDLVEVWRTCHGR